MLLFLQNGNWVDRSCEEKHGFICMKQSATESTGEEVEVNIGCNAVSQACFLNNIAAGIVRKQSSHTSAGCSAEFSHGPFLPKTFQLASCTLTCGDIYKNAEIISSFCDAFGGKKFNWIVTPKTCVLQGWKRHGSYCYFVGTAMKKFDEAKSDCEASGSYLADVSNGLEPPKLSHYCCRDRFFFMRFALTLRFIPETTL